MENKKIFILLPDGVGLRNFAYTNFYKLGKQMDFEITYWNNTPFDLAALGFKDLKIGKQKSHPLTEIFKNAKTHIELNLFINKFNDSTYNSYRFPFSITTVKQKLKTVLTQCIIQLYDSESRLKKLRERIIQFEKKTSYFQDCLHTLKQEKPAFVFCTNQRHVSAIACIEAAKQLGIPTGTFIFSWDNLPKATLVVDTDYYFVWSEFMKAELIKYYPHIKKEQILITGTPQFENHFNANLKISKEAFFADHNLELSKKYICFSGDDVTTSPNDPTYLRDTAEAVRSLNNKGYNLGIVFRRCPADFSTRFDEVLKEFSNEIVSIAPVWEKTGEGWNTILPTAEDMVLQTNTIAHTEFVINLGSSMVFDYVTYNKPCVYVNYGVAHSISSKWRVDAIYKFIHFRSMPSQETVIWFNSPNEIQNKIEILLNQVSDVSAAQKWFEIINCSPPELASQRIWENIARIVK